MGNSSKKPQENIASSALLCLREGQGVEHHTILGGDNAAFNGFMLFVNKEIGLCLLCKYLPVGKYNNS